MILGSFYRSKKSNCSRARWLVRLFALWLLVVQSIAASHAAQDHDHDDPVVDCQVCQVFERLAPPAVEPLPPRFSGFATAVEPLGSVQRLTPATHYVRPPGRAPPN